MSTDGDEESTTAPPTTPPPTTSPPTAAPRYVAYVVRRDSASPQFADLGDGAEVDSDVARLRAALKDPERTDVKELARRLKTSQQHISRLESPGYEGHSLANLRRVATVLNARVRVSFEPEQNPMRRNARTAVSGKRKRSATRSKE